MALWKLILKQQGMINSVYLEKGIFVEMVTPGENPMSFPKYQDTIARLFLNKYGIDLKQAKVINNNYIESVQIIK